jgi:polysaccharide biosynthesis transport protein
MEGAPLNVFTDTKELIKYADGLIAIFSADATYTAADKESISFLMENKEKFLGAILNRVQEDNLNL